MALGTIGSLGGVSSTIGGAVGGVNDAVGGVVDKIGGLFGGGVDRSEGRLGETPVTELARALEAGKIRVSGPVRLQVEYHPPASDKGDESGRRRILNQGLAALPTARRVDDGGHIHNELTISPDDIQGAAQIAERERAAKVFVVSANVEEIPEDEQTPGNTQTPDDARENVASNNEVQTAGVTAGQVAGVAFLVLALGVAFSSRLTS